MKQYSRKDFIKRERIDYDKVDKVFRDERGKIKTEDFADFLIREHGICFVDDQICVYRPGDGSYSYDSEEIEYALTDYLKNTTSHQRTEIMKMVRIKAGKAGLVKSSGKNANLILFRNGVYNTYTKELLPFSKDYVILNKIDWDYNPEAYSEYVDTMLDKISCYDSEIRAIIEEMIGYSMLRSLNYDKAFIMVGAKAANGKTTFTRVLEELLCEKNLTSVDLRSVCDVKDEYTQAQLYGKLANIGDDISGEYIPDPSVFKSVTTGARVRGRHIYGHPFFFRPYATMIFSAQHMPKLKDADNGVMRRLVIIPFDYQFNNDKNLDVEFESKIIDGTKECSTDESMSYLINLAISGIDRLLKNKKFTTSKKVEEALKEYEKECNPTLEWAEEFLEMYETFDMKKRDDIYNSYVEWTERTKQKPLSQGKFVRFINDRYNMQVVNKTGNVKYFENK